MAALRHGFAILLLAFTASVPAAELGPIEVLSGLGQRLRAKIPVSISPDKFSVACMKARVESMDGAILAYPQMSTLGTGSAITLQLISAKHIDEPAAIIILEHRCAGNAITRSYPILLDPPNLATVEPVAVKEPEEASNETPLAAPELQATPIPANRARTARRSPSAKEVHAQVEPPAATPKMRPRPKHAAIAKKVPKARIAPKAVLKLSSEDDTHLPSIQQLIEKKANATIAPAAPPSASAPNAGSTQPLATVPTQAELEDAELKELNRNLAALEVRVAMLKRHAELAQLAAAEKERQLFSKEWIIGLVALVFLCLAAIIWLGWQYVKLARRASLLLEPAGPERKYYVQDRAPQSETAVTREIFGMTEDDATAPLRFLDSFGNTRQESRETVK